MIQRKKKKCKRCNEDKYIFSRGLCNFCYYIENANNIKKNIILKKNYRIAKVSKSQKERNKIYSKLRAQYLEKNPICEVCKQSQSNQIHHKAGRIGDNLFKYFLATCDICHKKIEMNPKWSYEQGYTITRLKNE